jgi:hypothetical protein
MSYVLTRHVYLCTQHTDVGSVWCGHWTDRQRCNVDQVDVMRYNPPNSTEYADAGSRAMKSKVRDVHQTYSVGTNKKPAQIKILLPSTVQFESVRTCVGLSL